MADDKEHDPFSQLPAGDALGDGATRMFSLKMESWLTDIAADIEAPAAESPPEAAIAPAALPAEPPAIAADPAVNAPFAPAPFAPAPFAPAPFAPADVPFAPAAAPAPYAPDVHTPFGRTSSHDLASHAPGPASPEPFAPLAPPTARASSPDLSSHAAPHDAHTAAPTASAVPPIPSLAGSAVPPIPALAGTGPAFEPRPRTWLLVLGILCALMLGGSAAAWLFMGPKIRALLGI